MPDKLSTLLPFPSRVRKLPGRFAIGRHTPVTPVSAAQQAADTVRRVLSELPWPPGDTMQAPRAGPRESRDPADLTSAPGLILVDIDPALPGEGYRLLIGQDRIKIAAGGPAGAFYAAQTIRQLLPDEAWRAAPIPGPAWQLPCADIEDGPALGWRGAHLDVARHFFPKRTLLTFIDMLAAHKLNRLHLHLTDDQGWRIESRRYPALHLTGSHRPQTLAGRAQTLAGRAHAPPAVYDGTPHGGYYTLKDLAEIAAYAAQRMVRIVPEIDVPGHASALLSAIPGLAPSDGARYRVGTGWGTFSQIVSPLPATVRVLEEIFGELLGAVPADCVHIGGDECVLDDWRASPRVDDYRRTLGLPSHEALHGHFLRQVADVLADRFGVRAVVWDEGFASSAHDAGGTRLRDDTLVMAWRGDDIALRAALAGHDIIATPVMPTYFDYRQADDDKEPLAIGGPITIEDVAALRPVPADWPDSAARHLLGTQFQLWTEYIPDPRLLDYMTFPRACALAEVAWQGTPAPWTTEADTTGAGAPDGNRPPLCDRVATHLGRLTAAGIEYRPLDGPHPWQQGGTGPRRHRTGPPTAQVTNHLADQGSGGAELMGESAELAAGNTELAGGAEVTGGAELADEMGVQSRKQGQPPG